MINFQKRKKNQIEITKILFIIKLINQHETHGNTSLFEFTDTHECNPIARHVSLSIQQTSGSVAG